MNRHPVAFSSAFLYYEAHCITREGYYLQLRYYRLFGSTILCIVGFSLGCNESFSPTAPFVPRMAVYSVLTTQSDTQYVRIYANYLPPDNNPNNNPEEATVSDAVVTISDGTMTYTFRDTAIARPDTSRYQNPIHLYYCYPMTAEPGKQYTLQATSPTYGTATSNVVVPSEAPAQMTSRNVLNNPGVFTNALALEYLPAQNAYAYLLRMYIVFTAENPWESPETRHLEKVFEVPALRVSMNPLLEQCRIYYPDIRKLTPTAQNRNQQQGPKYTVYAFSNFQYRLSLALLQRVHFNVRYKRAVFYIVQFDEAWYKYYATANLFEDQLGVRLDEPSYSNISTGAGLFGGMRVDSVVVAMNEYVQPFSPPLYSEDGFFYCRQESPPPSDVLGDFKKLSFRP